MKNNIFISIIVPVYNTPVEILKSCFDSVKNQTYDDWELIVVDDGSEKDCACWIDDYCKDIQNKQVIHKKNDGVSIARNEGVKLASGEWITFLDSDNTLPLDTIEIYHNVVNSNQSENVELIIGYSVMGQRILKNGEDIISLKGTVNEFPVDEKKCVKSTDETIEYVQDKDELVNHLLAGNVKRWKKNDTYFSDGPCGKLIRVDVAKNILFPDDLKWEEDTIWLLNIVSISENIIIIPNIVYNNIEFFLSATRKFRKNCLNEFYNVCDAEKKLENMFSNCKTAFAYKRFGNILLVSRLYFFHRNNSCSKSQRYVNFLSWCKHELTERVANDVIENIGDIGFKAFVSRLFSKMLLLKMYKMCWFLLLIYNKRF